MKIVDITLIDILSTITESTSAVCAALLAACCPEFVCLCLLACACVRAYTRVLCVCACECACACAKSESECLKKQKNRRKRKRKLIQTKSSYFYTIRARVHCKSGQNSAKTAQK